MGGGTKQESDGKREEADLLVLPRSAKSLQSGLSSTERAVGKCARATFAKEKGTELFVQSTKSYGERESR